MNGRGSKNLRQKSKPFSWKIAGKLLGPPDPYDGEVTWIIEIDVESYFPGFEQYGHPTVQFMAGTKSELWVDAREPDAPEPPIYRYTVEVNLREAGGPTRYFSVVRYWDAQGRACKPNRAKNRFLLALERQEYLGCALEEGIYKAIITGSVRDYVGVYEGIWRGITPQLLEMSQAHDVRKMEELYLGPMVGHEELHTDVGGYDEGRESVVEVLRKDQSVLPLLRMPPPEKVKVARPIEHHELHTDNSESEYDV